MLRRSPQIWHVNKRGSFEHNILASDILIWKRCCHKDFNSVWARFPYCLSKHPLKWDFLDIYLTTFWEYVTWEIQNLRGLSFVSKYSKFNLDFENAVKIWGKNFCFWDNCMWIGNVQLSLLRRGYFSSADNVLTSSPKIWHVNKRNFFQLNWLGSDQWIS